MNIYIFRMVNYLSIPPAICNCQHSIYSLIYYLNLLFLVKIVQLDFEVPSIATLTGWSSVCYKLLRAFCFLIVLNVDIIEFSSTSCLRSIYFTRVSCILSISAEKAYTSNSLLSKSPTRACHYVGEVRPSPRQAFSLLSDQAALVAHQSLCFVRKNALPPTYSLPLDRRLCLRSIFFGIKIRPRT